jgi:hypothetical protein
LPLCYLSGPCWEKAANKSSQTADSVRKMKCF